VPECQIEDGGWIASAQRRVEHSRKNTCHCRQCQCSLLCTDRSVGPERRGQASVNYLNFY
jgi:hypothetical protein